MRETRQRPIGIHPAIIERSRNFLVRRLREQQQLARSLLGGQTCLVPRPVWRQSPSGRYQRETIIVELRPLWFEGIDGNLYLSMKYLGQTVQFDPGRYAVPLGFLADVSNALASIIDRIEWRGLDSHLVELHKRRKRLRGMML